MASRLQRLTGAEARVTSLGQVQRGGRPMPFNRLLCMRLGTKAGELVAEHHYNNMVALKETECVPLPLKKGLASSGLSLLTTHGSRPSDAVETCMGD